MCGIGGILRVWAPEHRAEALATPHVRSIPEAWLDVLDESIKHRGPDGRGRFRDRTARPDGSVVDVAFVHRRLSIIDHAGGHQPMLSLGRGMGVVGGKRVVLGGGLGLYEGDAASELVGEGFDGASRVSESGTPDASGPPHLSLTREAPSSRAGGRVCVVFNGCIYNHRELRAELQRAGHVFSTDHSDTEVLVHGWREWGDGLLDRLDGMYALAIWDAYRAELVIARDRFGEKPLYLVDQDRWMPGAPPTAFASAVPGLARLSADWSGPGAGERIGGGEAREGGRWALAQFVALGWSDGPLPVPGVRECPVDWFFPHGRGRRPGTRDELDIFAGASGLPPREMAAARGPGAHPFRSGRDVDEAVAAAVASRLDADVALGCFLSGGVDSSLVALHARRHLGRLSTFTVRMPAGHDRLDESAHAARAAAIIGSQHHVVDAAPRPAEDLGALISQLGLPFGDSSLLAACWVSREARVSGGLRVAIGGDGGDELFAGYARQHAWRRRIMLGPLLWALSPRVLARERASPAPARRSRAEKILRLRQAVRSGDYLDLLRIFPDAELRALAPPLADLARRAMRCGGPDDWRTQELGGFLPHDLMRKLDTASMAVALEVRSPLLARDLADRAEATPPGLLTRRGRKWLLRAAAKRHFPADLIDRPKQGFAIPIGEWFRSDYGGLRTMLLDHLNSTEPFGPPSLGIDLNMRYVRQMLDEHLGTGPSGRVVRDHSQRLYMLLVLSVWAKWVGGWGGGGWGVGGAWGGDGVTE